MGDGGLDPGRLQHTNRRAVRQRAATPDLHPADGQKHENKEANEEKAAYGNALDAINSPLEQHRLHFQQRLKIGTQCEERVRDKEGNATR